MGYFKYSQDGMKTMRPDGDSFLRNVPQEKLFVPKADAKHRIRLMPPWSAKGIIARHVKMHYRVGLGQATFICPDVFGDPCPFCEVHLTLKREYEKYKPDVDAVRSANRYYANIVHLENEQAGVMVYGFGWTVFKMIYDILDNGMYGDISDPKTGRNLLLIRSGSGRQARDAIYADPEISRIAKPDWLDQIFDLDNIFNRPNMDIVQASFKNHPWKIYTSPEERQAAQVSQVGIPEAKNSESPKESISDAAPTGSDAAPTGSDAAPTGSDQVPTDLDKEKDKLQEIDEFEEKLKKKLKKSTKK